MLESLFKGSVVDKYFLTHIQQEISLYYHSLLFTVKLQSIMKGPFISEVTAQTNKLDSVSWYFVGHADLILEL